MTQVGESVAVILPGGNKKCVFCGKSHQDEEPAPTANFDRDMSTLKREGRADTKDGWKCAYYPHEEWSPLVPWEKDINKTGGYKAAAHHCIALKEVSGHKISGELKAAEYDPNGGNNCIWLPYSTLQFYRARTFRKPLQKHRGGHTDRYFIKVAEHIDRIADQVAKKFCTKKKKTSNEKLLRFASFEEDDIWKAVADVVTDDYKLYSKSYLEPRAPFPNPEWPEETIVAANVKGSLPAAMVAVLEEADAESVANEDPE